MAEQVELVSIWRFPITLTAYVGDSPFRTDVVHCYIEDGALSEADAKIQAQAFIDGQRVTIATRNLRAELGEGQLIEVDTRDLVHGDK